MMMAVVLLTCFIALVGAQQARAANHGHEKKHDVKKLVEALEEQWRKAQLAGDVATMDKMLSEDFIGISMSGQVNTKAQQLERVRSRKLVVTKVELSDMKVKLVGSVAIVTSQADVEGTNEGVSVKGKYRYTRVYQRRPSGEWKITSFEATRIQPPRSQSEKEKTSGSTPPASGAPAEEPRFG
jgi:ketosteroid isomerase-like protein